MADGVSVESTPLDENSWTLTCIAIVASYGNPYNNCLEHFLKRIAFMTGCIVPKVLSVKLGGVRMSEFRFKIVIYLSRA